MQRLLCLLLLSAPLGARSAERRRAIAPDEFHVKVEKRDAVDTNEFHLSSNQFKLNLRQSKVRITHPSLSLSLSLSLRDESFQQLTYPNFVVIFLLNPLRTETQCSFSNAKTPR